VIGQRDSERYDKNFARWWKTIKFKNTTLRERKVVREAIRKAKW
jgi:hypothetical protein